MNKCAEQKEAGFTIIEIMTVCSIIGILSAISVPVFSSQRESAVEATLVSDVRNAAMEMEKQAIFSATGYAPEIPATFFESSGNTIVVDASTSSQHSYCVIGSSPEYDDMFYYYHSDYRAVTKDMKTCGFIPIEEMGPLPLSPSIVPTAPPTREPTPIPAVTSTPSPTAEPSPESSPSPTPGKPTSTPTPTSSSSPSPAPVTTPSPAVPPVAAKPAKTVAPAPTGYDNPKKKKYTICHNGNTLELPLPAILNGHSGHEGDIIPLIPGQYTGQNWTIQGSAIWHNNCAGMNSIDYRG